MNSDTYAGTIAEWEAAMDPYEVPEHLRDGIARFVLFGVPPGRFLEALLTNDLRRAATDSTPMSFASIPNTLSFLHWNVPMECHGTPARYEAWIKRGGLMMHTKAPQS
jgi:hypothetical protein